MLAAASRLALPGLFLSLVTASPALAQSRPAAPETAAPCYRTIADRSGEAATARPAESRCSEPREGLMHGGFVSHAIMMVADGAAAAIEPARPASSWRDARPRFTEPPVYR